MHRIGSLYHHGPVTVRVIGQYFIDDDIAGYEAADNRGPHHRTLAGTAPAAGDILQGSRNILSTRIAKLPTLHPQQFFQVAGQGGVPVHLHPQVLEHGD